MKTPRRLTDEQLPEAGSYVLAIFLSGATLWMLLTLRMVISPPSNADLCGDEAAMCCRLCAAVAWFTIVPFVAFFFCLDIFSARLPDRALNCARRCLVAASLLDSCMGRDMRHRIRSSCGRFRDHRTKINRAQ